MPRALLICCTMLASLAAADEPTISPAQRHPEGWLVHSVVSPFQSGETSIRVLLPTRLDANRKYPVLYVLPVEAGLGERWGDGLIEVQKAGLHDKYGLICVAPTFSSLPWYADHPTDPGIRQEQYLLDAVVPFVERTYPALAERRGRLLVGFSKSGWGAYSLLLRHPDRFERAAAWDSPMMLDAPGKYGSGPIFGTSENFAKYHVPSLLRDRAKECRTGPRLVLLGYDNFREPTQQAHALLEELRIPHVYRDGPQREHHWNSGWLPEAVELLVHPTPAGDTP
jgi:S-formylglutathione hydrolase FrmB